MGFTQPPMYWVREYVFQEEEKGKHEADHSPLSSAEWNYAFVTPYVLVEWRLVN
jgi:hypothetical protein